MNNKEYLPRIIDREVDETLGVAGAICIEGCKWCGKTRTSEHHAGSAVYIGDPAGNYSNRTLAGLSPLMVLNGDTPRLIDEWQEVPPLWDAVRSEVDKRSEPGQFILTGSATPNKEGKMHSGAGRIVKMRMRPMSLYESKDSTGKISLEKICSGQSENLLTGDVDLGDLIDFVVRGGWPGNLSTKREKAGLLSKAYIRAVLDEDIEKIEKVIHDKRKMERLLKSLARNESTTASIKTLMRDMQDNEGVSVSADTISDYLDIFDKLFLLDNTPPFSSNIRSSVRIKQQEKRHLCDPSLACALLDANREKLLNDLNTFGFLFEAMCERDLRIYAESFGGKLYHYQDYNGREIDAVIELPDGNWSAIEIKLGAHQIDDAADNLNKISNAFKKEPNGKPPISKIIVCGMTNAAYLRPDGVYVAPITALKP